MGTPAQKLQAERLRYPGLLPREIIILRNWLRLHEQEYDRFDYNIRVGQGQDPGPGYADESRENWKMLTRLRVDVAAFRGDEVTLIEVKDRATASAIGQVLNYGVLWKREGRSPSKIKLMVITNRIVPDIIPILEETGVTLELVEADFGELRRSTSV